MAIGLIIIAVFLFMVILMYLNKISALLALPTMAIVFTLIATIPTLDYSKLWTDYLTAVEYKPTFWNFITYWRDTIANSSLLKVVLLEGAVRLHSAYTIAFFGGMLAIFIKKKGIAEAIIRYTAELAGDRPKTVAIVMYFVTAILFITLGGLGAVIMVGTIIFPILLSLGTPPMVAAGIMLIGLCTGGAINPLNWVFYKDALGVPIEVTKVFALKLTILYILIGLLFILIGLRKKELRYYHTSFDQSSATGKVRLLALFTPIVPIFLALVLKWDPLPAFIAGLIYGFITTYEKNKESLKTFTQSLFEGAESVIPAVLLMIGIGMLLKAVTLPTVSDSLKPILQSIIPKSRISYVIVFTVLSPLALYRGPLNVWGMGSGLAGIILSTGLLPAPAIMAMLMSVGTLQGVCDPTNTHNVWIAGYLNLDVVSITKKLLPYIWTLSALGLIIASVSYL